MNSTKRGNLVSIKYAIGLDFGTESSRAVILNLTTGEQEIQVVREYPHGVVDSVFLETGEQLPANWAIQYPQDYLLTLQATVNEALQLTKIAPENIIALAVDTTACTLIPTDETNSALADQPHWRQQPYAYAKLWKDHSSQPEADRINSLADAEGEEFLSYYGGKISSEWVLAKSLRMYEQAPEVFAAAKKIYECGDWITSQLVGKEVRGKAVAGYKASFQPDLGGYPSENFLDALNPGFSQLLAKLGSNLSNPGERAGYLTEEWAEKLGLTTKTAVAVPHLDAHVAMLGSGIFEPNEMLLVMGTSVCNLMLSEQLSFVPGMAGAVKDGLVPGFWGYEAGQPGVGDTFGWFAKNLISEDVSKEAAASGRSSFDVIADRAAKLAPGESGLVALDWFNGNRSTLVDADLSGMILGLTLATRPEDIYRALLEASAFGQRKIFEAFRASGVSVNRVVVCGGLPHKAPLFMQILADVLELPIEVSAYENTPAIGAALHAAIAAGPEQGGCNGFADAKSLVKKASLVYQPNPSTYKTYRKIYAIYDRLYQQFGHDIDETMHELRRLVD